MDLGKLLPTICLVVLALVREPGWAQPVPASAPAFDDGVLCTLTSDRLVLRAGSPLLVQVSLANHSQRSIKFKQPFTNAFGTVWIQLRATGSSEWQLVYAAISGIRSVGLRADILLEPGSVVSEHVLLFCGGTGQGRPDEPRRPFVFSTPGRYELRGKVRHREGEVYSEPVTIDVLPAHPRVEAVAQQFDVSMSAEEQFQNPRYRELENLGSDLGIISAEGCNARSLDVLRQNFDGIPEFSPLITYAEGCVLTDSREEADWPRGMAKLQALRESPEPSSGVWQKLAAERLAYQYARQGDQEKARKLLGDLKYRSELTRRTEATLENHAMQPQSRPAR